jgi:glycosyltransferase involved in cell wall biosynthesis
VTSLGIEDSVRFVGWLDDRTRFEYLAAARLVVVPSRFETFGMVALEAFAVGTPVVAFDIPCLRDIVPEQCGRLVPAFDVAAFATAVSEVYHDDRWLARASDHARLFAASHDWDALATRQLAVYVAEARPTAVPAPRGAEPVTSADPSGA